MLEQQAGSIVYCGTAAPASGTASGGGLAPQAISNRKIVKSGTTYSLTWTDPADTTVNGQVLCAWGGTKIVRKEGSFPQSPTDGVVVLDNKVRNQYALEPFVDTVDDADKVYKYRAFPYSVNGVYGMQTQNMFDRWVFTFKELITESAPDYRITYDDDNANYTPGHMDFTTGKFDFGDWANCPLIAWENLRPCMVYNTDAGNDKNGTVAYYLDPNDHSKKYGSDEASDVSNPDFPGNAMVEVRRVFTKIVVDGNYIITSFSNEKLDDGYECYQCKKADGTYADFFYVPMFMASLIDGKFRSLAGQTLNKSKTASQEISYAQANGSGWNIETWADDQYFEALTKLIIGSTNAQAKIGEGITSGGESSLLSTGTTLDKGMMYGSNTTTVAVKAFYRENPWGSQWRRMVGMLLVNGVWKVKMTKSTVDGSTASDYNLTGEGYITLEVATPSGTSGGYISTIEQAGKYGCFPTVMSGTESTYECDGCWFNNSITAVPQRGGSAADGRVCGPSYLNVSLTATGAYWNISAALSYHQ